MNMKTNSTTLAIALTCALAAGTFTNNVYAAKAQANDTYIVDSIEIPGHAKSVLNDVRGARIAIFDGQIDAATDLVNKAHSSFDKSLIAEDAVMLDDKRFGVPIDSSMTFAEDFKPSEKDNKVIKSAGEIAKKGDPKKAVKTMLDAGIELSFSYAFLPVMSTVNKLNEVQAHLEAKNYYQANMVLKAIESSVVVEEFGSEETPKQGYSWKEIIN